MHYVIGDIHGCLDELLKLKSRIEDQDSNVEFILLGDIIDRGPKVVETCKWFRENVSSDGRIKSVIGNHEWDKVNVFNKILRCCDESTLESDWKYINEDFDTGYGSTRKFSTFREYAEFINFCRSLPFYIDLTINDKRFIIVHADLPITVINDTGKLIDNSDLTYKQQEEIVWNRKYSGFNILNNTILVCGHTPTIASEFLFSAHHPEAESGKVYKYDNRYNIDCGLVYRHRDSNLAALCLETEKIFYLYDL